jgi:hypothetical protein
MPAAAPRHSRRETIAMMASKLTAKQGRRADESCPESRFFFGFWQPHAAASLLFSGPGCGAESHRPRPAKTQAPVGFCRDHPQRYTVPSAFAQNESLQLPGFRQTLPNHSGQ